MTDGSVRVVTTVDAIRELARPGTVGFVPTMGFLHDGHASLIRRARAENEMVVVSIFVNPTQFGPGEDFATYPRDQARDLELLARERADIAFMPDTAEMYPPGADTAVTPGRVADPLEGASRPGHFRGVATVVTMLFNAVRPHRVYFGEKDWQQLQVVRHLARDLHLPVDVVGVPTTRELDGLAMSSRNVRLSSAERVQALCVPRALAAARLVFQRGEVTPSALTDTMRTVVAAEPGATLDYAAVVDAETLAPIPIATSSSRALIAVRVGAVRLIDNCAIGNG